MMNLDDHLDIDQESRIRTINLGNNKIYMKRKDPYGFVYINFDKGQIPEELKGSFTDFEMAKRAVSNYLEAKGRVPVEK